MKGSSKKAVKSKPKKYSAKRRAIYARGDDIDPVLLYDLHWWICHICKEPIDPALRVPNPRAASLDHIIPLSKGGEHVWANCAPSHLECNYKKGAALDNPLDQE